MKTKVYKIKIMGPNKRGEFWLRVVARNGLIVATTEQYPSELVALKTAMALASARLEVEEK